MPPFFGGVFESIDIQMVVYFVSGVAGRLHHALTVRSFFFPPLSLSLHVLSLHILSLSPSSCFRRLSLADGLFGDSAALALGEALTKNTRLEELSLRSNGGITPRGALGLLESLRAGRGNMVLSLLDLGGREGGLVDNHEFQAFRAQHLARAAGVGGVGGMKGKTGMKLKPKSEEFKRQLFRYRVSGGRGEAPDAVIEDEETRVLLETAEAWPEVLDSTLLEGIEAICARNRDWKVREGVEEEGGRRREGRRRRRRGGKDACLLWLWLLLVVVVVSVSC